MRLGSKCPIDILPHLSLTLAGLETGKEGDSYCVQPLARLDRFGGFLLHRAA